eukprot:CAMPEP_0178448366 /NCGR_PEP_ID=MMETSP0689_2-20121128/41946_1 /TAXON_ID=160604 /ORGANISM="Amphidinium massartii, Strain CS-259" /LENGTH=111 /DNA_ID=CAMNT_0020073547 /DNA_START=1 /DNA_END=336 /DNA_ORIENTATION=+
MCSVPSDASTAADDSMCPLRSRSAMAFPEPDEAVKGHSEVRILARSRSAMLDEDDMIEIPVGRMRSAMLPDVEVLDDEKRQTSKGSKSTGLSSHSLSSMLNPLLKSLRICQ